MPAVLARYLDGRHDSKWLVGVCRPYFRFELWMEIWCPRLAGQPYPYDIVDLMVRTFYEGVLPWLGYGLDGPPATGRAIDLVDLVDELMVNQNQWYAHAVAWPLRDVLRVFADVFTTLYLEPWRDLLVVWDLPTQAWLLEKFGDVIRALEAHEGCCTEIRINVHWW